MIERWKNDQQVKILAQQLLSVESENRNVDKYMLDHQKSRHWGTDFDLHVLADTLGIRINVFAASSNVWTVHGPGLPESNANLNHEKPGIYILATGCHFQVLWY